MTAPRTPIAPENLRWNLERGLGKGLWLLRAAPLDEAREAVLHVCIHETRWDPDREDRGHYLAKALAIAGDAAIEAQVLDRWEREIPWKFRGPWSEVGLVLAGLGHGRAVELATRESEDSECEEGPGLPAFPEGFSDVKEWIEAIRDDARLRLGGGLRIGRIAREEDLPVVREALMDEQCPHLQEAVSVACTRIPDDEARDWILDRIEEEGSGERSFWWWQGLSGQRPAVRARDLAIRSMDTVPAACLQWVLRTLVVQGDPGVEVAVVRLVERSLHEAAEDAVTVALDWMKINWHPDYEGTVVRVLRSSSYGPNRSAAVDLSGTVGLTLAEEDLLMLLEDADLNCRLGALKQLDPVGAENRLRELGAQDREDPAFLAAVQGVLG